jgi:8-oxo-dGTP pyrophosphatase MutT (NUDIX family)
MPQARPATTILLLREADAGLEIFMVQRHRKSGFLPNAWVFPGGRVDAGDALDGHPRISGGSDVLQQMGMENRGEAIAFLVAGIRETFEESGIWLGSGQLPDSLRDPLNRGEVGFDAVLETHDVRLDLDRVRAWSYWVTPKAEPRRYDTHFLIALVQDAIGRHDERETVDSRWVSPSTVMKADYSVADFPMAPPTWWTLRELAAFESAQQAWDAAQERPHRPIQPIMEFTESGLNLILPGHPSHDQPRFEDLPTRVAFCGGQWVAFDGDVEMAVFPHTQVLNT